MNQQRMQIFIKKNPITGFNRIENVLYRTFSLCILCTTILFGQSNLFSSGNNRPVADAGPDIKVQSTSSIQLDASRSFINDGSKLKFEWIFAPGLVYNNENEFPSELLVKPYDGTYLKSVQTYKPQVVVLWCVCRLLYVVMLLPSRMLGKTRSGLGHDGLWCRTMILP